MFLDSKFPFSSTLSFPRMRGDVPLAAGATRTVVVFSPHTRGCSEHFYQLITMIFVFPACAGMFRSGLV